LYYQKLESLTYFYDTDSMGLRLLLYTQLFWKLEPPEFETAGTKTDFDMK